MRINVLIITNTEGFGVLIQQTLEETGGYTARLISFSDLTTLPDKADVIIVDTDYGIVESDQLDTFADQAASLQFAFPEAVTVLVPPANDFSHAIISRLKPAGLLTKPFYLPDLVSMIDRLINPTAPAHIPGRETASPVRIQRTNQPEAPAWLQDVDRAAQYLARLSLESSAQAALIVRGSTLWAYAGEMNYDEVQELTQVVATYQVYQTKPLRSTPGSSRSDLARYTRLPASGKEVMVYVTALAEGLRLVLAYDAATPFSMIRMQANHLARVLSTRPDSQEITISEEKPLEASPVEQYSLAASPTIPAGIANLLPPDALPLDETIPPYHPGQPSASQPDNQNVGSYNPQTRDEPQPFINAQLAPAINPDEKAAPGGPGSPTGLEISPQSKITTVPNSPIHANLTFACLLVPRVPGHCLTGDLAFCLAEQVPQICLAYGWRLEQIAIQPDYLGWVVRAAPSTAPGRIIRVARQRTSRRIFTDFPSLEGENSSGDFWAPGYFIASADSLPAESQVRDFIHQTRLYQINPDSMPPRIQR